MNVLSNIKLIAETVTTISTAFIVIYNVIKLILRSSKINTFFTKTIPLFFKGTMTDDKKKVRGFKAVQIDKEYQMRFQNIIDTLAPNITSDEVLILDKVELIRVLSESSIFKKVTSRK